MMIRMAETVTKVDEYRPTAKEKRLVEAMSDPKNRNLNITELCKVAGISREAYYQMMRKPAFVEYYKRIQYEVVKSSIAKVLQSTIKFAIENPKCHQDRKMLLEMSGMYTPKQEVDTNIGNKDGKPFETAQHVDLRGLSAAELAQLEAILSKAQE